MKNILLIYFSIFLIQSSQACELLNNLALKNLPRGYTFIKSYSIDGRYRSRKKIVYTLVLSKGTHYYFSLAEKKFFIHPQLKATILTSRREVVSSNEKEGQLLTKISFRAPKAGLYYLRFEFTKDKRACGAAVLGFYHFRFQPNQNYEALMKISTDTKTTTCRFRFR